MAKKAKKPAFTLTDELWPVAEECVAITQSLLNLQHWRIELSRDKAHKSNLAEIHISDDSDCIAMLRFGVNSEPWTVERVAMLVVHELMHPFLHPLIDTASRGRMSDPVIDAQEHRIINVLTPHYTERLLDILSSQMEFDEEETEEVMH